MKRLILILTFAVFITCLAQKTNTTRAKLKLNKLPDTEIEADTVAPVKGDFVVSGFEKVQSSTQESMFISSTADYEASAVELTITYKNLRGETLHKRVEWVNSVIPPGDTRNITIRSFDRQKVWYYVNTQGRHNANSSPFDVTIKVSHVRVLK